MSFWLRRLAVVSTVVVAGACASGHGDSPARAAGDPDRIAREEIDRGQWRDVYDLVRSLRPAWLRTRGDDSFESPGEVQVYVDGTRLGGVQLLRTLPTHAIDHLEWIDPVSAAGRWGLNHAHGVIYITYSRDMDPIPGTDSLDAAGAARGPLQP